MLQTLNRNHSSLTLIPTQVPQETELAEFEAGGFERLAGPFSYPYIASGYGIVFRVA